jgi:hypothetical protein
MGAIHEALGAVAFGTTALAEVARLQIVGIGDAANSLEEAGAGTTPIATVVSNFTGSGLDDRIDSTPLPDISLPPPEPPPAPEIVVTPLPDGTQKIVVTPRSSEEILDASGEPIVDSTFFQFTVPVLGENTLKVTRLLIEADRGPDGPQFIEVRTSIDGFATVVARIATIEGTSGYTIDLMLPESTSSVTIQIKAVEPAPVVKPGEGDEFIDRDEGFQFTIVSAEGIFTPLHKTPRLADHLASRGASPVAISKVPQEFYLPVTPGEHGKALGKVKKILEAIDLSISEAPPIDPPPGPPTLPKNKPKK